MEEALQRGHLRGAGEGPAGVVAVGRGGGGRGGLLGAAVEGGRESTQRALGQYRIQKRRYRTVDGLAGANDTNHYRLIAFLKTVWSELRRKSTLKKHVVATYASRSIIAQWMMQVGREG